MSITLNGDFLKAQFADSTISTTNAEVVLDGAINMLNAFRADIDNLTGTAGSKTGTYTSAEVGAIMAMAQQIYQKHFKNPQGITNTAIGGVNSGFSMDTQLLTFAKTLARELRYSVASTTPPIYLSNDPIPTS